MALISEVVTELSVISGIPEKSVTLVARYLREAGLLSQKGRGRGAAHATPLDAARLCIALMVGGKAKDAAEAVTDFGGLVCRTMESEPDHKYAEFNLEAVGGLEPDHHFEDALACLIGVWRDEAVVAAMDARRGRLGLWPGMLAVIRESPLTGEIWFGGSHYWYDHPALLEISHARASAANGNGPEPGLAEELAAAERYFAISRKYASGIRSTREISGVELMPLGEVVAGNRPAGYRESDEEFARQMLERDRQWREAEQED